MSNDTGTIQILFGNARRVSVGSRRNLLTDFSPPKGGEPSLVLRLGRLPRAAYSV